MIILFKWLGAISCVTIRKELQMQGSVIWKLMNDNDLVVMYGNEAVPFVAWLHR